MSHSACERGADARGAATHIHSKSRPRPSAAEALALLPKAHVRATLKVCFPSSSGAERTTFVLWRVCPQGSSACAPGARAADDVPRGPQLRRGQDAPPAPRLLLFVLDGARAPCAPRGRVRKMLLDVERAAARWKRPNVYFLTLRGSEGSRCSREEWRASACACMRDVCGLARRGRARGRAGVPVRMGARRPDLDR